MPSESTSAVPMNISRLAYGVKWICLPTNPNKNSGSSLPQKYVSFKKRTRNYRKRRPTITFIPPRVNAFSASGIIVGFIPTTEASTGISRLPTIRLIHFRVKLVGHILIMKFRYGMCMCIGGRVADNIRKNNRPIDRNEELSIDLLFYCQSTVFLLFALRHIFVSLYKAQFPE